MIAGKKPKGKSASIAETPDSGPSTKKPKLSDGERAKTAEDESQASESETDDDGKDQLKVLKSLKLPEIESGSFSSSWCPKVIQCLNKRVAKLEAIKQNFPQDGAMTDVQSQYEPQTPLH